MRPNVPEVEVSDIPDAADRPPYILDVREPDEWGAGHIDSAQHIPMMELPARLEELPKDERVYVVCRGGGRSSRATAFLTEHGVDAVNVAGGMKAWKAAARSMVGPPGQQPEVI
jgi:rhodanese-related sulfurtransferase